MQEITRETLPLIADMHAGIKQANADLMKLDTVLDTAESISTTVDSASRMAYGAVANPLVKAMSTGTGVLRAFRGFRGRFGDHWRHLLNHIVEAFDRVIHSEDRIDQCFEPAGAPDQQNGADDDPRRQRPHCRPVGKKPRLASSWHLR